MKNIKITYISAFLGLSLFFAVSCSSNEPEVIDEPELITTLNVTFTNVADAADIVTATFRDIDGPGGNAGTFTQTTLKANTSYSVMVAFLNESVSPTEDITEEVREEDEDHQVFFIAGAALNLSYTYNDMDSDGNPIGLSGSANLTGASIGSLDVVLIHEPNKSATGVSTGDIANAGGEEDIRVQFTVTVQ